MNDLHSFISNAGLDASSPLFEEAISYLIRSQSKGTSVASYNESFRKSCTGWDDDNTPSRFRTSLHYQHYIAAACKYYANFVVMNYRMKPLALYTFRTQYGISGRDAVRIIDMMSSTNTRRTMLSVIHSAGISKDMITPAAFTETINLGKRLVAGLDRSVKIHVRRKLAWVANANNQGKLDAAAEILGELISTFYRLVPTRMSEEHVHNYLCKTIHHRIDNMNSHHSSQKRKRSVKHEVGGETHYVLLEASEAHLNLADSHIPLDEMSSEQSEDVAVKQFEFTRSVTRFMSRVGNDYLRKMYNVLLGVDVTEFHEFLLRKRFLRSTNKTVRDWMQSKSLQSLAGIFSKWLGVHEDDVHTGMKNLAAAVL